MTAKQRRQLLVAAALAALVLWFFPYARFLVLPFIYLNTHLHELSHALMALLTGGQVRHIVVEATGGGYAVTAGGSRFLIASAGYTGSAVFGGLMILLANSEQGARRALWGLSIVLAFGMVFYVRGDLIGLLSGAFWVAAAGLLASKSGRDIAIFAAQFLGVVQCLAAISAVRDLIWINANMFETRNDAVAVAEIAPFGPLFWAVLWLVFSLVVAVVTLKKAWHHTDDSPPVDVWRSPQGPQR